MQHAFVFDTNRCTGCAACQLACSIENQLEPDCSWRAISTFNARREPDIPLFHLSMACNHCADPACMTACPALAYSKDLDTGAVLLDENKCIGCGYCAWACPYDAPRYDADRGVMTKCTFCNHRLQDGRTPACAALCPTGALSVAWLPAKELTQPVDGFSPTMIGPAIKIIAPKFNAVTTSGAATVPAGPLHKAAAGSKITLRKEWPVAIFTLQAALMFAMVARPDASARPWHGAAFVVAALVGMLLGAAHLGRKARAWRIVLNVAHSPLSREIAAFSLFAAAGAIHLLLAPSNLLASWTAVGLGLVALVAIEDVYRFTIRPLPSVPHSANVVLTGILLVGVLWGTGAGVSLVALSATVGIVKVALYVARKRALAIAGTEWRPRWSVLRLGLGIAAVPLLLLDPGAQSLAIACVLIGEVIDRGELYEELEVMTPRLQMRRDEARLRQAREAG